MIILDHTKIHFLIDDPAPFPYAPQSKIRDTTNLPHFWSAQVPPTCP